MTCFDTKARRYRDIEGAYSVEYGPPEVLNAKSVSISRGQMELYRIGAASAKNSVWAEFGVAGGRSARQLTRLLPDDGQLFLFDSWQGLPEPWDLSPNFVEPAGSWKHEKWQSSDDRHIFVDGLFFDTLPYEFPADQLGLVHIDCDLYSSTVDVLAGIHSRLKSGTVMIFDEIYGYANYAKHEYRAFCEWREWTGHKVTWLARDCFAAVCVIE